MKAIPKKFDTPGANREAERVKREAKLARKAKTAIETSGERRGKPTPRERWQDDPIRFW